MHHCMDGEPETIKRVCCKAALTARTFVTPSISLGSPLELETIKKVCCEAGLASPDFHFSQHSIWVTSL